MIGFLEGVPEVLFKYRNHQESFHKDLLYKRELYFPTANKFNDPYDATLPLRYKPEELTEDQIFLKYRMMTIEEHPDWKEEQVQAHCYEYQQRGYLKDESHVQKVRNQTIDVLHKSYGIVSLTANPYNFLMWSHYALSHTGYCIGFDKHELFKHADAKFANVDYHEEIPELGLFEDGLSSLHKLTYTKAKFWEYEQEYRIASIQNANKKIQLPIEAVKQIILGVKMPQEEKFKIVNFVKANYNHAEVYDLSLGDKAFQLTPMRIL